MKRILLLSCIALSAFAGWAQDFRNTMSAKKKNYTSFDLPVQRKVNAELSARTNDKYKKHPEYGILPYSMEFVDCYEILEDRTATTRHFIKNGTDGNTFYSQTGASAINYQDADGNWRAIDSRIFPSENTGVFEAKDQPSPVRIDLNNKNVAVFNGSTQLAYNRNLKLYHQVGTQKNLVATADWSRATVGRDGAYVKDIFPGIDLEMYAITGGVKTNYIIASKLAFSDGSLLIEDEMKLPYGSSFSYERASKDEQGYHGLITVNTKESNIPLYEIGEPVGSDMSTERSHTQKFSYLFDANNVSIVVPVSWMNRENMVFPLVIDPLVTSTGTLLQANIGGSGGNGSGTFNAATACPWFCPVVVPANCTITDVKFAFDYIAQNGAIKSDGGFDFQYTNAGGTTCTLPGLYTCNNPLPGACTTAVGGTSIYTYFASCITPQCPSYTMNWKMRFYDKWGGACDNTFIGANSNWVMTVEGHTVEFQNPGAPITLSLGNTICSGQSQTATTAGVYGVGPYTVNWSFNSSGTPSVGTGLSASINFPTAGTYTLYCFLQDNCNATTLTANTTVTVNQTPAVTASPLVNPICSGQTTTLTASGANTFTWSANAGGGTGSTAAVTPTVGQTVYTVTGTSSGCNSTATTTVTVNPLPTVTVSANPTSICPSQSATLTAGGASTYTWSSNEGGSSNNPTTVTPSATDTYTVTATDVNNCVNTAQITVSVTPTPTITATASLSTICAGGTSTLTASGGTTYSWSSGGTAATETVAPTNTTTYTVTETSGACPGTATVTVNVNALPIITFTASPTPICAGQSSTITVNGASTYTWSSNSGGGNNNPITVSPTNNETYTVSATGSNGCIDSTTVSVNVDTPVTLAVSATDTTLCAGQTTTLTATGATNYTWSPGSATTTTNAVTPGGTTTYTLIGASGACKDSTTFMVNVNSLPNVSAIASPPTICSGDSSLLTASNANTYTWSSGAGSVQTNTVYVTPGTAGNTIYSVSGTDGNGCVGTAQVTVSVTATPTITALATPTNVCSGSTATLSANGTAATYTWSTGDTLQTTTTTPTIDPTTYTVTGSNGTCTSFTTVTIGVTQQPTVTATATTLAPICSGTADTLIATVSPSTVTATFVWTPGGGSNDSIVVAPGTTTPYTVVATVGTCTASATTTVTVKPVPTLTITSGGAQTVCSGDTVHSVLFNAGAGASVNWTNNGAGIGLASSGQDSIHWYLSPVVNAVQSGTITATPTLNGCSGTPQTFVITVNPRPSIIGTYTITNSICGAPGSILGLTGVGGTGQLQYHWTMSGVAVGSNPDLTNVFGGSYLLTVTDANNCPAWAGPYTINASTPVIVNASATPTSGSATLDVSFTGNTTGATIWAWDFGNGTSSGAQNPVGVYTTGGDYIATLVATNAEGCTGMDTVHIHVDQAISLVVPNIFSPNGDNINDEFGFISMGITDLTCEIFNRWGQKVKSLSSPTDKWDGKLDNGNNATDGTYFYTVVAKSYDGKPHNKQGTITLVR